MAAQWFSVEHFRYIPSAYRRTDFVGGHDVGVIIRGEHLTKRLLYGAFISSVSEACVWNNGGGDAEMQRDIANIGGLKSRVRLLFS